MSQSENTPGAYEPGTYENADGVARVASSASAAVQLVFEGFKRSGDLPAGEDEQPASDTTRSETVEAGKPAPKNSKPKDS